MVKQKKLFQGLYAFQHLPAGTTLPTLPDAEAERLWRGLLRLPESTGALGWLVTEAPGLAARLQLWQLLDALHGMLRAALFADGGHRQAVEAQHGWLGEGWQAALEALQPLEGKNPFSLPAGELLAGWSELRRRWRGPRGGSQDESLRRIEALFRLDAAADPLAWLQTQPGDDGGLIVLARLLDEVNAAILTRLPVDEPARRIRLRQRHKAGKTHFELVEISLGARHFDLRLDCRLPASLAGAPQHLPVQVEWGGSWQISDGQGNCYPIVQRWLEGGARWGRFQYDLRLRAFPAIAPPVQQLTIHLSAGALWRGDLVWLTLPLAGGVAPPISGGERGY